MVTQNLDVMLALWDHDSVPSPRPFSGLGSLLTLIPRDRYWLVVLESDLGG